MIIGAVYPLVSGAIGGLSFLIFGAIILLSTIFVHFCVPETRGKSITEIQKYFLDAEHIQNITIPNQKGCNYSRRESFHFTWIQTFSFILKINIYLCLTIILNKQLSSAHFQKFIGAFMNFSGIHLNALLMFFFSMEEFSNSPVAQWVRKWFLSFRTN